MLGHLTRLTGEAAMSYSRATGAALNCYGDEPQYRLSSADAEEIYVEDPESLWIDVLPTVEA